MLYLFCESNEVKNNSKTLCSVFSYCTLLYTKRIAKIFDGLKTTIRVTPYKNGRHKIAIVHLESVKIFEIMSHHGSSSGICISFASHTVKCTKSDQNNSTKQRRQPRAVTTKKHAKYTEISQQSYTQCLKNLSILAI